MSIPQKSGTPTKKVAVRQTKVAPKLAEKLTPLIQAQPQVVVADEELDDITRELIAIEKIVPEPVHKFGALVPDEDVAGDVEDVENIDIQLGDSVSGEDDDDGTDEPDDDGHNYEDDATDGILARVAFTPTPKVESIIPTQQIVDDNGRDVIMLWKPERCLTCSYLVGDLTINGEETVANDKCHHEFATRGGVRVGNPNCPAKTLRFVKGVNFDKLSSGLAQAMRDKDVAGLHAIYGELATLDPAVSKRVVSLAEESL